MVNSVTPPSAYGASGNTYTDDANATTGLDNYGYTARLIPLFSDGVHLVDYSVTQAAAAAASAVAAAASSASALNAPGTNATQTSGSVAIATGSKTFTIQSGKAYVVGQTLVAASAADPSNYMTGQVTAYSGTSLTLNVTQIGGSGTKSDFVFSMGAIVSTTLPGQTGNSGKFLTTDGTSASWSASALAVVFGGTGATTAAAARTNLGLSIGTNVQAQDAGLQSIANLTTAADTLIYTTASDTYATTPLTTYGRSLIDDVDASTARTTLGAQAAHANLATLAGLTLAADKLAYATGAGTLALTSFSSFARTLVDDPNAATALGTLGAAASGTNSDITSLTNLTTPLSAAQGGTGRTGGWGSEGFRLLKATQASTFSQTITVTADSITMVDTNGVPLRASGVSCSPTLASAGTVNALDTGTVAAFTWYALWAVSNGTTTGCIYSTSFSAPTMPSGYGFKTLVGAVRTDVSGYVMPFIQAGRDWRYIVSGSPTPTAVQADGGGAETWATAIDMTFWIPTAIAATVIGVIDAPESSNGWVGPNSSVQEVGRVTGSAGGNTRLWFDFVLESPYIYMGGGLNAHLYIYGCRLNL
jgi:hypothetical protein